METDPMSNFLRQRQIKAKKPANRQREQGGQAGSEPRLPHEHDESADSQAGAPTKVMEQARQDIESGKQDTDRHGLPGLEKPQRHRA
jgi:hypothetical protein